MITSPISSKAAFTEPPRITLSDLRAAPYSAAVFSRSASLLSRHTPMPAPACACDATAQPFVNAVRSGQHVPLESGLVFSEVTMHEPEYGQALVLSHGMFETNLFVFQSHSPTTALRQQVRSSWIPATTLATESVSCRHCSGCRVRSKMFLASASAFWIAGFGARSKPCETMDRRSDRMHV